MDEGRKRVPLIAASILAARRLAEWDGGPASPKFVAAVSDSIRVAERILQAIDELAEQAQDQQRLPQPCQAAR